MSTHKYMTKYGVVNHSDVCKDDWSNIATVTFHKLGGETYTLQRAAIRSLNATTKSLTGRQGKLFPILVTGTHRTCALQARLYKSDPHRYAHPNSTLHTQGLAIDVDMNVLTPRMRDALLAHGWHQSRPDDEPWHFSFRLTA